MSELKIKVEALPIRCEICHHADCYIAVSNHCSRCCDITAQAYIEQHQAIAKVKARYMAKEMKNVGWFNLSMVTIPVILFFLAYIAGAFLNLYSGIISP